MMGREIVKKNQRDSNMELLRIVAMILIMVLHADFASLSVPTIEQCYDSLFVSFSRFFIEGLAVVAVNAFVLLSGWYGIKASFQKISVFVFQTLFIIFFVYFCFLCIGKGGSHSIGEWLKIVFFNQYWFVQSYIILYAFSPILNAFVEKANKRTLEWVLVSLFVIQLLWGCLPYSANYGWYNDGYSPIAFFFLYLLARYIRLYVESVNMRNAKFYLLGWFFLSFIIALLAFVSVCSGYAGTHMLYLYGYSSPLVVMGALMLLLFFSRISIRSSVVNKIAASAYAIYIVHCHECIFNPIYITSVRNWFVGNPFCLFLMKTFLFLLLLFVLSVVIDRIRMIAWFLLLKFLKCLKCLR